MKYVIDIIALAIIYFWKFRKKWQAQGREVILVKTLMYIYLSFVFYFTLMPIICSIPFIFSHPIGIINFEAFIDVSLGRGDFWRQIILNVIMTVPFGIMCPIILKMDGKEKKLFARTISKCFILILCIEVLQPIINDFRSADITDMITNIIGCCIGYALYLVFKPVIFRILDAIKER